MQLAARRLTPKTIGTQGPNFKVVIVTKGATRMAVEMLKSPMRAKSLGVAVKNTLFER